MVDDQKDPTEREREDEDLELDEEQSEDVKGGAVVIGQKTASTIYSKDKLAGFDSSTPTTTTPDRISSTQPLGGLSGGTTS